MNLNGAIFILIINLTFMNIFSVINVSFFWENLAILFRWLIFPTLLADILLGATDLSTRAQQWNVSRGRLFPFENGSRSKMMFEAIGDEVINVCFSTSNSFPRRYLCRPSL